MYRTVMDTKGDAKDVGMGYWRDECTCLETVYGNGDSSLCDESRRDACCDKWIGVHQRKCLTVASGPAVARGNWQYLEMRKVKMRHIIGKIVSVCLYIIIVVFGVRLWLESADVGYWPCLGSALVGTVLSAWVNYQRGETGVDGLPIRFVPLAWTAGILLMTVVWEIVK